ncbi:MAG: GolD/DthD family dehydrogenase [Christensenellales bacterium]
MGIDFNLKDKVAVVTGAGSGLGLAAARQFLEAGAFVAFLDINDSIRRIAAEVHPQRTMAVRMDVTQKRQVESAVEAVMDAYGRIDVLLNSAGIALLDAAEALSEDDWDKTIDVNLKGTFLMAQAVGKRMIAQGCGSIINLASQAGIIALDRHVAYTASKAGVIGLTKAFALEWAGYSVRVNAISPTIIMTELGKRAWAGKPGEDMKKIIPMRRFGVPGEVAACAQFLASDASSLITGENMVADAGYTIQ